MHTTFHTQSDNARFSCSPLEKFTTRLLYLFLSVIMSLSLPGGPAAHSKMAVGAPSASALQRTRRPMVTGSSVLGIKYAGGVMLASDTLCSYGSMAKFKDARRITAIGGRESFDATSGAPLPPSHPTLLGGGGEYSDYQAIVDMLRSDATAEYCADDGHFQSPEETWSYLRAVMYQRRNKMNPFWNDLIVAGCDPTTKVPFLGSVDKIGTAYTDDVMATGFGSYIAVPIMRERFRADMEEGEARALLEDCMRVLFYRDCRALNRIVIAKATADGGCLVSEPYELETSWDAKSFVSDKAGLGTDGGW